MNAVVEGILKGCYDLHVHAGPDPNQERRLDVLETARFAYEAEMGGMVLHSLEYPTAPLAYVLNRMYPGLKVAGSIALNSEVGGLNPEAVEAAANLDAKMVWMPTSRPECYVDNDRQCRRIGLTDDKGKLRAEVRDILDIVGRRDMMLASGHASAHDTILLFTEAKARGINRLIATHSGLAATVDEQRQMIALGAYIELAFIACMPCCDGMSTNELAGALQTLGAEHCIVTTGFGQWMNPPAAEGMRMAIAALLRADMRPDEVSALVKTNPSELLGFK